MTETNQLPLPSKDRWHILRAGLQNIWEYDDCRLVFHRGRLLLRGANESGKTKALEVLLPFLLDADLAPQRLDPFGSMARPMRWNLLNDGNRHVEVSVGYVWLEFGRRANGSMEFCTIGAGLRAKRSNPTVDSWYFITTRRIDDDLRLLDERRVPATQTQLTAAIGEGGQVFERAGEYRRKVNERLFGMPDEQYDTLIEALLQLRRPKLSERLNPEELSRILTASLPPLEARVVGSLAEGFERLDRHRSERDEFERTLATVKEFLRVYRGYVAVIAKARAQEVTKADSLYQKLRSEQRDREGEHSAACGAQAELEARIAEMEGEEVSVDERLQTLRTSDAYRAVEQLDEAERVARVQVEALRKVEGRLRDEKQDLDAREAKRKKADAAVEAQTRRLAACRARASKAAVEAALDGSHGAVDELVVRELADEARSTIESLAENRKDAIASLEVEVRKAAGAKAEADRAEAKQKDAAERDRTAVEALAREEADLRRHEEDFRREVESWLAALMTLRADAESVAALLAAELDDMRARADMIAEPVRRTLHDEAAETRGALARNERDLGDTRAKHDELAQQTHAAPAAPAWRAPRPLERPGAPLYLLCDFRNPEGNHGVLEAALESAGLLDAWVMPSGAVLHPRTFDLVLTPSPAAGQTLLDVLVPNEAGGVALAVVERVLGSIGLVEDHAADERTCWVATDGRWRLGPLGGAWEKLEPAFIGTTARERARAKQLAELAEQIAELERDRTRLEELLVLNTRRREALEKEFAQFPDLRRILEGRAHVAAAAAEAGAARADHERAKQAYARLYATWQGLLVVRDAAAVARGLLAWIESLDELKDRTRDYRAMGLELVHETREFARGRQALTERVDELKSASARVERTENEAAEARLEARRTEARALALREAIGSTRDELLRTLAALDGQLVRLRGDLARLRGDERKNASQRVGVTAKALETAVADVGRADGARTETSRELKTFSARGRLGLLGIELEGTPETWTFTDTLLTARKLDAAVGAVDCSQDAMDVADTRVASKQQDLTQRLPPDIRLVAGRTDGVLEYRATFNGRPRELLELVADLESDVAARQRLLDDEERNLFESFLTGETHQHLGARLRQANALVDRMRNELHARPTSSGMVLGLKWEVSGEAPSGTKQAIDLLLRSGHLLTDGDRGALRSFLEQRLDEAHTEDGAGTLEERMLQVLDYRRWFTFTVQVKAAGQDWRPLTRKQHDAGSGGQKGVMLQLPLFAAAAAFYESAGPHAPRLIMLDEAFSGIDRKMRGKLMGLFREFELDFVMTSFEEWGFYEELDGLSTYHLSREQGMPGVYMDWFIWDGKQPVQMNT